MHNICKVLYSNDEIRIYVWNWGERRSTSFWSLMQACTNSCLFRLIIIFRQQLKKSLWTLSLFHQSWCPSWWRCPGLSPRGSAGPPPTPSPVYTGSAHQVLDHHLVRAHHRVDRLHDPGHLKQVDPTISVLVVHAEGEQTIIFQQMNRITALLRLNIWQILNTIFWHHQSTFILLIWTETLPKLHDLKTFNTILPKLSEFNVENFNWIFFLLQQHQMNESAIFNL